MKVLVDNAISGSVVYDAARNGRCVNLHANTGALAGTDPDIILVNMGINDCGAATINTAMFEPAYNSLLKQMTERYTASDIFVMTLPKPTTGNHESVDSYNEIIRAAAKTYNVNVIEMRESAADDANNLTVDKLHPNATGMQKYYEVIRDALYAYYCAE